MLVFLAWKKGLHGNSEWHLRIWALAATQCKLVKWWQPFWSGRSRNNRLSRKLTENFQRLGGLWRNITELNRHQRKVREINRPSRRPPPQSGGQQRHHLIPNKCLICKPFFTWEHSQKFKVIKFWSFGSEKCLGFLVASFLSIFPRTNRLKICPQQKSPHSSLRKKKFVTCNSLWEHPRLTFSPPRY